MPQSVWQLVAEGNGGAISGGVNTIIDCTFTANCAGVDGGAISSVGAAAIINCTFTLNFANAGAALDDGSIGFAWPYGRCGTLPGS